jgi:hypothetical protein
MGYVPDYENDVFISYSHIDNEPLSDDQIGWIDNFHKNLERRLAQVLGVQPQVWRDPKLKGNDYFDETIVQQFPKVAILLSVFSPRYVKSDWCLKELQEFCSAAERKEGLRVETKSRIFKVVKTPVERSAFPPEVQSLLGYEFYRIDETGKPREFRQEVKPEVDLNYWNKLDDLVYDVQALLKSIKVLRGGTEVPAGTCCVYLAQTTSDLSIERDKIRRELEQNYTILPDQELPVDAQELQKAIRRYLQCSKLSVHIMGSLYGMIPEKETRSIGELQNILAAERSTDPEFARLIWMPKGLEPREDRQKEYIQKLQYDQEALKGAEFLQTSLEELKAIIYDKLKPSHKTDAVTADSPGPQTIYLMCDERDFDATKSLEEYLFKAGFDILLPAFEGEAEDVQKAHQVNLLRCDAALIYYGLASDSWLTVKISDLQKMFGYGRSKPLRAKAIYICPPDTKQKQRLQTRDMLLIRCPDIFTPSVLDEFLEQLRNGKGGAAR